MSNTTTKFITAVLMLCSPVAFGQTAFKANLDQAQAGGTGSAATGTAILCLNAAMTEMTINVNFTGITTAQISGFHIHNAPAGMNGGVVFGMVSPNHDLNDFINLGNGYSSRWDPADVGAATLPGQLAALNASGLYFNAHTAAFPGGEIRGQILPVLFGDMNLDGVKNLLDVIGFVNLLSTGGYQIEGDVNKDMQINLLDVQGFVAAIIGGC